MVEIVTDQVEADRAFRRWTDCLISGSTQVGYGWVIEGSGVVFSNYGHGPPGTLVDEVMLGADPAYRTGVVKIVRADTARLDRGRLTVIARDDFGRRLLLREGWLKPNALSGPVRETFAALSGLQPAPLQVNDRISRRDWYVVADLDATPDEIVARTADFALACARARAATGGAQTIDNDQPSYTLALDEAGKIYTVTPSGEPRDVCALQGYVYEALKAIIGDALVKPTKNRFEADGVIVRANLLLEIKTGTSPQDVYGAVGQLKLYPHLIGLEPDLEPVLLVPDHPPLKPMLAAAVHATLIDLYTYAVDTEHQPPRIKFSRHFLARCGVTPDD